MKKLSILLMSTIWLFTGCASLPFQQAPEQPKTIAQWHQTETTNPVIVGQVDGKSVVANQVSRSYDVGVEKTEPKKTLWQILTGWFLGLGVLGGFFAFLCPSAFFAFILWALHKYQTMKQAYLDHKDALTETVKAIKQTKIVDNHQPLHDALKNAQSPQSQQLIAQIAATV